MIELASLHVYPVKGCAGIDLERVELEAHGPRFDREWMIVDARGDFASQRRSPRLALVRTALEGDVLTLTAPGLEPLAVPAGADASACGNDRLVRCWGDRCLAHDVGDPAAAWLERFLGAPHRLVRIAEKGVRRVDPQYARTPATTRFTDGFPLLLIGQASLDGLNERLESPLGMRRFRPNLVVRGAEAHAEDGWRRIRIGSLELDVVKACSRCSVVTVDPETADRRAEPLATLAKYRSQTRARPGSRALERVVLFGQNLVHRSTGTLEVGAEVQVEERAPAAGGAQPSR